MTLKVLHFSTADREGGSAASAYRIHTGLLRAGHISRMLVGKKITNDPEIELVGGTSFSRYLDLFMDRYNRLRGHQYLSVPSSKRLLRHPWLKETDIIQLFNTHGGYFSHTLLPELSRIAPVVWRLSDMWPMTPHAAYSYSCECYAKGIEACQCKLAYYPAIYQDTRKMLWDEKQKIYEKTKLTIVAPSSDMYEKAKKSILLSKFPIHLIRNGINTEIFYPRKQLESRRLLNIPENAKVILFCSHGVDNNERKGSNLLIEALKQIENIPNVMLLLAGLGGETFEAALSMPVRKLGFIRDQERLAAIYTVADIIAVPSVAENLPNTVLESMACGTPAVAFDAGGMKDAVIHGETGFLAQPQNIEDFVRGMKKLLTDDAMKRSMGSVSLELVKQKFSREQELQAFLKLYSSLKSSHSYIRNNS